jgi:hypothetical protein
MEGRRRHRPASGACGGGGFPAIGGICGSGARLGTRLPQLRPAHRERGSILPALWPAGRPLDESRATRGKTGVTRVNWQIQEGASIRAHHSLATPDALVIGTGVVAAAAG